MSDQPELAAVINLVDASRVDWLKAHLAATSVVGVLDGTKIRDQETLLDEVGASLLDGKKLANWSQLEDLLRLKVLGARGGYELVWMDVNQVLTAGLAALLVATDIFYRVAREATEKGRSFRVFLVGTGPSFPL